MHDQQPAMLAQRTIFGTPKTSGWPIERVTSLMAGTMVLLTLTLGRLHTGRWRLLTGWVGANLLFNGVAGWCPMGVLLHRLGLRSAAEGDSGCCP